MDKRVHHYPRLDTIMMVEETIRKSRNRSRVQIWRSMPKKIMYQTFLLVLNYLEKSGKIANEKGKITWVHDPELIRKLVELSEYTYKK